MSLELSKRINTSIILFVTACFCTLVNKHVFTIGVFFVLFKCVSEWININKKYFDAKNIQKIKWKRFIINFNWQYIFIIFLGLLYALFVLISAHGLRGDSFEDGIFFIIVLCICAGSDIGGYVFGKTIGGKKLIKISPNKTISGSIGSFIFSMLPIFLFSSQNYINLNFDLSLKSILFCLIISLSCQLGDLIISYVKRLNKVKDTGNILPGHGGFLDRIDGIIFAIPAVYILKILQIF